MHASLAAIGRACTVEEDEDPPLTPVQSSLDLQQSDCIEQSLRLCTSTLEEIITLTLSLCKSIKILPNFNKAVILRNEMIKQQRLKANEMERNENEQPETSTECVSSPSTITNPTQSLVQTLTSTNNVNNLNKLTQLHRLCLTVYKVVHFETLNTTVKELSLGLTALLAHSENTIIKELHLFDCILRKFSISTNNIHSFQALYEKNSSNLLSDYHEFVLTTLLHVDEDSGDDDNDESDAYMTSRTTSTHYDHSSELGELRILCESLRQCWTQVKRLANEQRFIQYRINQLNTSNNYNLLLTRVFLDAFKLNSFYSKLLTLGIINSAQHLIYSGVSLLSYIELTRFTHDELWEMTRGIEELSILREYLHNTFQVYRNVHLHRFLFNNDTPVYCNTILFNINSNVNDSINNCKTLLSQIVTYDLIIDPGDVTFSITVGCLFSLFAKQRSLRLAHLTYLQLYKFLKLFTELTNINNNTTNDNSSRKYIIQQEFHKYIQDNHGLLASDYLRDEYEFISSFLDILSQSTDLLYQVQKLQYVCTSAVATAQVRQVEAEQRLKMSTISKHYPTLSHALSVEGKHGILIRNPSTNHSNQTELNDTSLKTLQKGDISCKTDLFSSYISRYQDALHRSNTLDRYVATGSPVSPYSSISNQTFYTDCNKMKLDDQLNQEHYIQDPDNISDTTSTTNHSSNKHIEENKSKLTSKKVVQWSDHREVSTRHQIIGRYLEITWKFTENTLTSLFLSTKSTFCKEQNIDKNEKILNKSSLIMSTEKLLQLGNNIRQLTATTDFFPAGLMSVLRKQALKCKEYAVWRNWYEECQVYKNMKYEGITYDIGDFQVLIDIQKKRDYMNSYRTCDHLDHTSLYSIYLNYHKQLTEEKRSYTQLQDATCHTVSKSSDCCIPIHLHQLWNSKLFLLTTDINSLIQIMLHIIKLFINDEHSWMKILSMIQVTIQSSGISSVVHKFNVIIPDSYSTLLLKVYKAYELSRRLDLNFTRLIIMLRNLSFNEYGICIKDFDCTLRSQQNKQEDVPLINRVNEISQLYKQSLQVEMIFIQIENIVKCLKNLVEIIFNNIINCILFWFGYTSENVSGEVIKGFKEFFNPINSNFLSSLSQSTSTSTTMTTTSINNMDDLVGITTGLLNADRNFLIRLARLIGSLGQMNGSLVTLDQDINIWKDELREKAIQTIIQLQESIIESKLKSKPYLEPFVHEEKDYFNDLLIIFLNPIYKTPENCLNSLKKTTFSIDEMYSLCQYHQYIFNYLTKPAIVSLFSSVLSSLKCQNLDSHDQFIQKYLIQDFQNCVPFSLLYEIFQSIRLHHIPVEAISGRCYSTASVESNFQLNEENPNGKRSNKSTANTSSSPPLPSIDLKHLRSKLNSGSTGVEIIQSTLVFMSSAMKNTMNKHLTEKPKAKLASFAADVYSNLRLPFRNQSTNDINTSNRTLTKTSTNKSINLSTYSTENKNSS